MENKEWANLETFQVFDSVRTHVREATACSVYSILATHVPPGSRVLEIGSGIGELESLISLGHSLRETGDPVFSPERVVSCDFSEVYNKTYLSISPQAHLVTADMTALPFPEHSFDVVVSLAAYDTVKDLDRAIVEAGRMGRKFIHILDLVPNTEEIVENYKDTHVLFPFVAMPDADKGPGIQLLGNADIRASISKLSRYIDNTLIESKKLTDFHKNALVEELLTVEPITSFEDIRRSLSKTFRGFILEPEKQNQVLSYHFPVTYYVLGILAENLPVTDKIVIPCAEDWFLQRMKQSLSQAGFGNIQSKYQPHVLGLPKKGDTSANFFKNRVGVFSLGFFPEIPPGKEIQFSTLQVIVAERG